MNQILWHNCQTRQPIFESGSPQIPDDLNNSPAVRFMTKEALEHRYDRIVQTLDRFKMSTPETAVLDQQLVSIL